MFTLSKQAWFYLAPALVVSIAAGAMFGKATSVADIVESAVQSPVTAIRHVFVPDPAALFGKDAIRVLLVGLDYDYNNLDEETSKSSRSDVIMALNLDFKHQRISELSIPRDMVATLPNGETAKINQAQSDGGITESKHVIADWLGIPGFDRYVVLRIDTSKDLVNAVGGITLDVKNSDALKHSGANGPIDYDDNWGHLHIHLKPGMQHLDGDNAVAYARFRHDWCSDPCRIMRQQQVIRAIVDKIEHDRLNTFTHAQALLAVIHKDLDTDFTAQEEISSALAFAHLQPQDIHTAQVPYVSTTMLPDYGDSLVPDEQAKAQLVARFFPSDTGQDIAARSPASLLRIHLQNGTTTPGLAARVASDLRRRGYTIADIGDAPDHDRAVTQIQTTVATDEGIDRLKTALGPAAVNAQISAATSSVEASSPDVTIVLGRDIAGGK